jgi:hypothetical protein
VALASSAEQPSALERSRARRALLGAAAGGGPLAVLGTFLAQIATKPLLITTIAAAGPVGEGEVWMGSQDGSVLVWSPVTAKMIAYTKLAHQGDVTALCPVLLSPSASASAAGGGPAEVPGTAAVVVWSGGKDGTLKAWRLRVDEDRRAEAGQAQRRGYLWHWRTRQADGPGVTSGTRLNLLQKERGEWKRRWAVLNAARGTLTLYKTVFDREKPREVLQLAGASVEACEEPQRKREHAFRVVESGGSKPAVLLAAEAAVERMQWIAALRQAGQRGGQPRLQCLHELPAATSLGGVTALGLLPPSAPHEPPQLLVASNDLRLRVYAARVPPALLREVNPLGEKPGLHPHALLLDSAPAPAPPASSRLYLAVERVVFCLDGGSLKFRSGLKGLSGSVRTMALGFPSQLWCADQRALLVFNMESGQRLATLPDSSQVTALARVGSNMWAAFATQPPQIRLYDLASFELMRLIETTHTDIITHLVLVDQNQVWSISRDRSFSIWK